MNFREAAVADIQQMAEVRHLVKENALSNPERVTLEDYNIYLLERGKGWICEKKGTLLGFGIADLKDRSIWALFIRPEWEDKGIGKKLQQLMLDWLFKNTKDTIWLTTAPGTRAEAFYKKSGWTPTGLTKNGELKFELSFDTWKQLQLLQ